ncbi:Cof-type HAD-IIB family hydrolase [Hydrogenispora sp. UU3]|uniref:Cof-type HAD-IIB family hydrolase n=2 Tax=Capillibacterium thermochitinicola TaxID=2699427 RepID=A0A8J6LT82_9FIRM|nr:Cof-type HAD-IIB family hydrolase [Capillibacterium thermochitinicola]
MIKMVVTDLDETLLRTDKSISKYTVDVINKVRQRGIKFIFATARGGSAKTLVDYELFDGYVLLNGAKAFVDNRLIYERTISADIFIPFLRELSHRNFMVAAEVEGIHYANFKVNEKWSYINNFMVTDYSDVSGSADKLYVLIDDPNQIDLITPILPKELYLNLTRDNLAMIMHKAATKFNGVLAVAEEFNIPKGEIIAFGDDINDKEMLLKFGLGVAMSNAIDEIKMIADYVCDTNDNDGVAKWLEENLLRYGGN